MVITAIEACKKAKNRCNIYSCDGFVCALFYDIIAEYRLHVGSEIPQKQLEEIAYKDNCLKCYQKACALLSVRGRSRGELMDKLREKEYAPEIISHTMDMLTDRGYLDDDAFAQEYAAYLLQKGYGKGIIRQKLYEKRIDRELIGQVVDNLDGDDTMDAALAYGEKAYRRAAREEDAFKRKNKFLAAMARHGFGYDLAKEVYNQLNQED